MGRETNYNEGLYSNDDKDKKLINAEEVKEKIGKQSLTTEEIAIYLTEYSKGKPIGKKTIENYIQKICKDSNGLLAKSDFMIGNIYVIRPELQGLLLTILNTNYFDGRKNQRLLRYREELYRDLIKNIDNYLNTDEKELIKESSMYVNALLESELTKKLNNELIVLMRELYHADSLVRFRMMKYVIEDISRLRKWVARTDTKIMSGKLVYSAQAEADSKSEEGKYLKEIIRSDSLEEYIIKILANKANGLNNKNDNGDDEIISYPGTYFAQILYDIDVGNNNEVNEILSQIDNNINNNARFCEIRDKAQHILNLNDSYESLIFKYLMALSKIHLIAPEVSKKDYINMTKFIESSMAKDKWDILNEFCNLGRKNKVQEK